VYLRVKHLRQSISVLTKILLITFVLVIALKLQVSIKLWALELTHTLELLRMSTVLISMLSATRKMMKNAILIDNKKVRMKMVMLRWLTLSNQKSKNRVFLITTRLSLQSRLNNSRILLLSQRFINFLLILLHQVFGKVKTLKRVFFASFLVVSPKSSLRVVRVDLDQRLMFSFAVIHQQLNPNYCSMFTNLLQEVSILLVKEVQLLVSLFM